MNRRVVTNQVSLGAKAREKDKTAGEAGGLQQSDFSPKAGTTADTENKKEGFLSLTLRRGLSPSEEQFPQEAIRLRALTSTEGQCSDWHQQAEGTKRNLNGDPGSTYSAPLTQRDNDTQAERLKLTEPKTPEGRQESVF